MERSRGINRNMYIDECKGTANTFIVSSKSYDLSMKLELNVLSGCGSFTVDNFTCS